MLTICYVTYLLKALNEVFSYMLRVTLEKRNILFKFVFEKIYNTWWRSDYSLILQLCNEGHQVLQCKPIYVSARLDAFEADSL